MKKFLSIVIIIVAAITASPVMYASGFISGQQQKKEVSPATAAKVIYTCPMHTEVVMDKPGKCPKCGMNLVKKEVPKVVYTCSMHPEVINDKPGKCPKCGMNLVKKEPVKQELPKKSSQLK